MHDRKRIMNDHAEGIIDLPGGFGTLEELFEMTTWGQLGLHRKPVGILNINGFYDHLIKFMDHMVVEGLLKQENREMLLISDSIEELLDKMDNHVAPEVTKWINKNEI
ncbi:LOG family protein YvdD [compost metagenome]